jgi:hypothetical protein
MAVNCQVDPIDMIRLGGITAMEDRAAEVAVRVMRPEIFPEVAVMEVVPLATETAKPLLSTVATPVLDDLQVTCVVISWLFPSEYPPEAANCIVTPTGMRGLTGVTDIERSLVVDLDPPLTPHPHVVRNAAKHPANNIAKKNLAFFIGKFSGKGAGWLAKNAAASCPLLAHPPAR